MNCLHIRLQCTYHDVFTRPYARIVYSTQQCTKLEMVAERLRKGEDGADSLQNFCELSWIAIESCRFVSDSNKICCCQDKACVACFESLVRLSSLQTLTEQSFSSAPEAKVPVFKALTQMTGAQWPSPLASMLSLPEITCSSCNASAQRPGIRPAWQQGPCVCFHHHSPTVHQPQEACASLMQRGITLSTGRLRTANKL